METMSQNLMEKAYSKFNETMDYIKNATIDNFDKEENNKSIEKYFLSKSKPSQVALKPGKKTDEGGRPMMRRDSSRKLR